MNTPVVVCPFLDPLTDFGFKYLFSTEVNKDLMISFLNAIFKGEKKIIDLNYGATEYAGNQQMYKKVFFDVMCIADDGEQFIIEMQQEKQKYFRDRCIFYLSRSINEQVAMGKRWQNPLKTVYIIALLNFKLTYSEPGSYLQDIALINKQTGTVFYNKLGFKFIELPGFNKKEEELESDLDKWLYILKNMSKLTQVPVSFQEGVFFRFFKQAELNKMSKIDRQIYESNWKAYNDYENSLSYAEMKGEMKGEMKNKLLIAQNLKHLGFSLIQIFEITGLPIVEIEKLD